MRGTETITTTRAMTNDKDNERGINTYRYRGTGIHTDRGIYRDRYRNGDNNRNTTRHV